MSTLASLMETYPQMMLNVRIQPQQRKLWKEDAAVQSVMTEYEEKLGENGRILVRESGTEPLIRVMVEGKDAVLMEAACKAITAAITAWAQRV
jgi:phosphoglucosamine mutase